jgi:hypothetical protein
MDDKPKVQGTLHVNCYAVLSDCVERGVASGWYHAHKHTDEPDEESIRRHLVDDILNEISEYFSFDDPEQ